MLTTEVRELVFGNWFPLGPIHKLVKLTCIFTELFSVTEQVRLTAVFSYSGMVKGVMVRVSWGGVTNGREGIVTMEIYDCAHDIWHYFLQAVLHKLYSQRICQM